MYGVEYFIICICCIIISRFWETNNLPIAIIMIVGLAFNIASIIYKTIVYKKNDHKKHYREMFYIDWKYNIVCGNYITIKKLRISYGHKIHSSQNYMLRKIL